MIVINIYYKSSVASTNISMSIYDCIKKFGNRKITFVCIGTDRCTGDSLGPFVGTRLSELGYNVLGTINENVHATNLQDIIENIPGDDIVIAIDAALGRQCSIGKISVNEGPLYPGASLNKDLPTVGDISIIANVNVAGFMNFQVLSSTRLSLVLAMADVIVESIDLAMCKFLNTGNDVINIQQFM